ncbi:MAG: glycosyltransferase [bacterium]
MSIVIPVWNQWEMTRACLESLAPTLRPGDQVIVVDNGSHDDTAAGLARFPFVTTIANATNRGFAAACNQGAALATGSTVVFLNNDTLLPDHWLDGLLAPFADAAVVATGPMSNCVSGAQLVAHADYDAASPSSFRAFARAWRDEHLGRASDAARLVGFCLAVRASALRSIGGWDERFETGGAEDDDLCLRLIEAGGRLLICHDSFVHHHGHATFDGNNLDWFAIQQRNVTRLIAKHSGQANMPRDASAPLLSACLIVKDEEALLPGCLHALRGVVDEVVVYDTGSSDGSVALARAAGATVVQGYWDDDFGRARNAALAHCAGEWVLHVDADEVFDGDATAVRTALERAGVDALALEIVNLGGDGRNDVSHRACRMFRRALFQWQGRLHEQVIHRTLGAAYEFGVLDGGRLIHSGYTPDRIAAKGKAERNIRIAGLDAAPDVDRDPVEKLLNLARSYMLGNRSEEALALFAQARSLHCDSLPCRRTLYRTAAQLCLSIGRPESALAWIDDLAQVSEATDVVRYLRGSAYVELARWTEALQAYDGLIEARDDDGIVLPGFIVHRHRARCHFMLEAWDEAADTSAAVATGAACDEQVWPILVESCQRTGRDIAAFLHAVPDSRMAAIFAQLAHLPAAIAHEFLEGLVDQPRYRANALALAIRLAPTMDVELAVRWSARLRDVGLAAQCPLVRKARDDSQPPDARILAAVAARVVFNDARAAAAIPSVCSAFDVAQRDDVLKQIQDLDPEAAENYLANGVESAKQM